MDRPEIHWIPAGENPWRTPLLDVRPVTQHLLSASSDPKCAQNAISFRGDDGTGFIGVPPVDERVVPASLRYRLDRLLADGVLFCPTEMEHKWALFHHGGRILCVRSWTREVRAVATLRAADGFAEVTSIVGTFASSDEEPDYTARYFDFLIRSHALDRVDPAPLPSGVAESPEQAAMWCMSNFGRRAHFATERALSLAIPDEPLRADSLLHIAAARGDAALAGRLLDAGIPADLRSHGGQLPLHFALAAKGSATIELLLGRGAAVDGKSLDGTTALMVAAEARSVKKARLLLDRGADPDAADARGFTALHRAAEAGELALVKLLIERGARPHPEAAEGQTPRSLAAGRGETRVVKLLDRRVG